MRRGLVLVLVLAARAAAWDSRCYLAGGPECLPGPAAARSRWIGPSDEHRALLELGRIVAGLPAATAGDFTLPVFTGDTSFPLVFFAADPPPPAIPVTSLQPVNFFATKRMQPRTMSVPEFAQLPDHAYALWDWALGHETCPLDPGVPAPACHEFKTHMGPVNSNHFVPQSAFFYEYYHRLALGRAADCARMTSRLAGAGGRFGDFPIACEREALVLEAVGQHFLQDAWATGHMWERWGSPDLADFPSLTDALLVAMTSGLIHGARAVLEDLPAAVTAALGTTEYHFDDPLNAPHPAVGFRGPTDALPHAGVGDLYLTNLIAQQGASFPEEYLRLFSCEAAGLRAVYEAAGSPEGPAGPLAAGLVAVDPTSDACFGQRVTNRAMLEGIGLDFSLPNGTRVRLELDSAVATHLVPILSTQAGGTPTEAQTAQYQVDMGHIVSVARLVAGRLPDGVELASGGLPPLLGIEANGHYVKTPLAPYVDPPLPWPGGAGADADRALALARTFHRAHAIDWCNRFRAGSPDLLDVDALRARVETLRASGAPDVEVQAACAACGEFTPRHLRVGHDETDYDRAREPLCHFLADDPAGTQYVFQPGDPGDAIPTLATAYCGCGTPPTTTTTTTLPVSSIIEEVRAGVLAHAGAASNGTDGTGQDDSKNTPAGLRGPFIFDGSPSATAMAMTPNLIATTASAQATFHASLTVDPVTGAVTVQGNGSGSATASYEVLGPGPTGGAAAEAEGSGGLSLVFRVQRQARVTAGGTSSLDPFYGDAGASLFRLDPAPGTTVWSHFGEAFAEQTRIEPGRYSFSAVGGTSLVGPTVVITDHSGMGSGAGSVNFTFTVVP